MNRLEGHIEHLEVSGDLSLVTVLLSGDLRIKAIVIDTPKSAPYLEKNKNVAILFKETEVVIGNHSDHKVSLQNKMLGPLKSLEQGQLLSCLTIQTEAGQIRSTISTAAVLALKLKPGMRIMAMVKLNEVMLSPL
ncbi:TOBE domain-containing protein [uncultured Muriicola sp.]|uniref:TOBE domain-containing protein n=1 Tax=uncultured Muriicola sp. TaxID=1583102 RepID=UPI002626DA34|nr:TOBE domain-containing protein [uncultured Muriicola sp.]